MVLIIHTLWLDVVVPVHGVTLLMVVGPLGLGSHMLLELILFIQSLLVLWQALWSVLLPSLAWVSSYVSLSICISLTSFSIWLIKRCNQTCRISHWGLRALIQSWVRLSSSCTLIQIIRGLCCTKRWWLPWRIQIHLVWSLQVILVLRNETTTLWSALRSGIDLGSIHFLSILPSTDISGVIASLTADNLGVVAL